MSAKNAVVILDTLVDIFEQMSLGNFLGLQIKEMTRRLHLIKSEVHWNNLYASLVSKMRAEAALYAMNYVPDDGCLDRRAYNVERLSDLRALFTGFRQTLMRDEQAEQAGSDTSGGAG